MSNDEDARLLAKLTLRLYGGDKEKAKEELKRCLAPHDPEVIPLMRNPSPCCIRDQVPQVFPENSEGTIKVWGKNNQ